MAEAHEFRWPCYAVYFYASPAHPDARSCRELAPVFVRDLVDATWSVLERRPGLSHAFVAAHVGDGWYRAQYIFECPEGARPTWRDLGFGNLMCRHDPAEVRGG